ncbi:MAG TPA: A24 family peptidase [Acidimicrobiales bacterium]|nr:A24 family peptidase [Acidimicrobiales bacterium]
MSVATTIGIAAAAAAFGALISPLAAKAIRETPPDPDDDPAPVPRVGPWLEQTRLLPVLLALVAAGVAMSTGLQWVVAAHVVAAVGLVTLSVIDLDLFLLPKRIVYPTLFATGALMALAAIAGDDGSSFRRAVISGFAGFGALLVLHVISPAGMGFGDVRLAGLIGLDLGWLGARQVMVGIFSGFVFAATVGVALLITRRRKTRDAVPFGPFLALGTLFILFGGDHLLGLARQ